jgi:hypothetical protein
MDQQFHCSTDRLCQSGCHSDIEQARRSRRRRFSGHHTFGECRILCCTSRSTRGTSCSGRPSSTCRWRGQQQHRTCYASSCGGTSGSGRVQRYGRGGCSGSRGAEQGGPIRGDPGCDSGVGDWENHVIMLGGKEIVVPEQLAMRLICDTTFTILLYIFSHQGTAGPGYEYKLNSRSPVFVQLAEERRTRERRLGNRYWIGAMISRLEGVLCRNMA